MQRWQGIASNFIFTIERLVLRFSQIKSRKGFFIFFSPSKFRRFRFVDQPSMHHFLISPVSILQKTRSSSSNAIPLVLANFENRFSISPYRFLLRDLELSESSRVVLGYVNMPVENSQTIRFADVTQKSAMLLYNQSQETFSTANHTQFYSRNRFR